MSVTARVLQLPRSPAKIARWQVLRVLLLLALFLTLVVTGYRAAIRDHLLEHYRWQSPGFVAVRHLAVWWFTAGGAMVILARRYVAPTLAAGLLGYTVLAFGVQAAAAVAFFGAASYLLGQAIAFRTRFPLKSSLEARIAAGLAGAALYVFVISLIAHFPINTPVCYLALLLPPFWLERHRTLRDFAALRNFFAPREMGWGAAAALVLTGFFAVCQTGMAALPDTGWDSLAMHLMLPAYVHAHRLWTFDVVSFSWAVMPMGGDWAYTTVYMFGGEAAAHLLNLAALFSCGGLIFALSRRVAGAGLSLLAVAIFLSSPLAEVETNTLFIENVLAALVAGAFAMLICLRTERCVQYVFWFFLLSGAAFSVKVGSSAYFVPLFASLVLILVQSRSSLRVSARLALMSGAIFLALGCVPYVTAYIRTGNPLFPFMNGVFRSPYGDPINVVDTRWTTPLSIRTLGDITFHAGRFLEYDNGASGVLYYVLVPVCALALILGAGDFLTAASLLVAVAGFLLVFHQLAYLRYIFPALPLISIAAAGTLEMMQRSGRMFVWVPVGFLLGGMSVNAFLSPWTRMNAFALDPLRPDAKREFLIAQRPQRLAIEFLNEKYRGQAAAVLTSPPDNAELLGPVYLNAWYNIRFAREISSARSADDVAQVAARHGIRLFIYERDHLNELNSPVRDFVSKDTQELVHFNGAVVCRLK